MSTVKTGPVASTGFLSMVWTYSRLPVTRTLYNWNLPLTRSNFQFLSDHFPHSFTLDNSNSRKLELFSISLEGSRYRESTSTVITLFTRAHTMATKNRPVASLRPEQWKENYRQLSKSSTSSFYQSSSSLFTNHLEVHSRRYMFLRKRRSCEYRHCRCQARIVIALNSLQGVWTNKIQYTKPPEHLCLLNNCKLLQLVLVRVLTWSCYMIWVPSFDLLKLMLVKHICLMPASCLSLINTRQDTRQLMNKLLIKTQPIRNEQKGALIAGVPYPISPLPFSLPPYPLSTPATQVTTIISQSTLRKDYLSIDFFALISQKLTISTHQH